MAMRILFLLLATIATAQQGTRDLGDAGLEDLAKIQVYSASRHLQNTAEAPASVNIVTAEEVQEHGYRTLADILRTVPGFYVTSDRNYSFVGVRGVGRLGDWNSLILVMVDGHRMNNNIFDQAMVGTEFPVDVDLIERVEIILGPSSSLYGTNAFQAVINVITRKRKQLHGVEVSAEAGGFNSYKGRASYGGGFKGLDMVLSATFYDSQGQTLFFP
jgi:iron complex outermembrane receptor protein